MKLLLKDIRPNPFRDLTCNPLNEDKITELISSINDTGFWDNCVVRMNSKGEPELAYGHHRVAAAIKVGLKEADFIVKDLDNVKMLQIMARENNETYRYSVLALLESVRGVVNALAEGTIPAFTVPKDTRKDYIYYAPSFVPGIVPESGCDSGRYTIDSIGNFLGFTKKQRNTTRASEKVVAAVGALNLIELGLMTKQEIKDWTVDLLYKEVYLRRDGYERTVIQRTKEQAAQKALYEKQMALQKQREAEREVESKRIEDMVACEREASAAKEKECAKELAERRKQEKERQEERQRKFEESRKKLDDKIEASKAREITLPKESISVVRAKQASGELRALRTEFDGIAHPHSYLHEKLGRLSRIELRPEERELMRQSLITLGDWYIEQANLFLPLQKMDSKKELEGLYKKEDEARKKNEATELYNEVAKRLEGEINQPKDKKKGKKENL